MTLPLPKIGQLVSRFRPAPARTPVPPALNVTAVAHMIEPALNVAAVAHMLERQRESLLAAVDQLANDQQREAYRTALHAIEAALDCARGPQLEQLKGLRGRARAAGVQRSYEKRLEVGLKHQLSELPRLLQEAAAAVKACGEAVQHTARQEVDKALERPVKPPRKGKAAA